MRIVPTPSKDWLRRLDLKKLVFRSWCSSVESPADSLPMRMQYYSAVWDYPLNVGGRPLHSWPAFIPITFELTVLFAAFAAVFGMLLMNGLPKPYHPVFNVPEFKLASQTRFFLCLEANDSQFRPAETRSFLETLGALAVREVEA